jgi:hypothetical protein
MSSQSSTGSCKKTIDVLAIIEFEKALNLNVEVGSIVL